MTVVSESNVSHPTIELEGVSKWFSGVVAVSEVTLSIYPGVTALLGPNGAGKSTLLRLLCGLTPPSRGRVRLDGKNPRADTDVFRTIGLVPQQEAVIEALTGHEFVLACARLSGVGDAARAATGAIELVDLDPADRRPLRTYSKGMRQRIKVAAALVHEPRVIVLDEPLEGLDPRQRLRMIRLFTRLGDEGRTVIVSSHVLDEVQRFGSRVVVMGQGRLLAEGDFREIRDLMDERPHRIRVRTDHPRRVAAGLLTDGAVVGARVDGTAVLVDTDDVQTFRHAVARVARDVDARLLEVVPLDDDLDSVFRYLVARRT
jgi:ABC-2 type transport system ATP-binding protein